MMRKPLAAAGWFAMTAVLLCGCGRKAAAPEASQPAAPKAVSISAEPEAAAPAPTPEAPAAAAASTPGVDPAPAGGMTQSEEQIKEELQAALQSYYLANASSPTRFTAPKTLDELVKKGLLKRIPTLPPGRKIVYHPENWLITVEDAK